MQFLAELHRSFAAKGAAQDDKFLLTCRVWLKGRAAAVAQMPQSPCHSA